MRELRVFSLFAGVGGFELGFQRAGHTVVGSCELDPSAGQVLAHHFPKVKRHLDIRTLKTLPRGTDTLTAGFPCQDLSQVGVRRGFSGERSGLVREALRLMKTSQVPYALFENVRFMLHVGRGDAMRYLLSEIEALGYMWAYRVVDTRAFGLPQRRERVLLLASKDADPRPILLGQQGEPDGVAKSAGRVSCGFYWTEGRTGLGWVENGVPPLKGNSGFGIPSPPAVVRRDGSIVIPGIEDAEYLQGLPRGWTRPATDASRGVRWRLVNNAVSVPVAQWVAERLCGRVGRFTDTGAEMPAVFPCAAWNVGSGRRASSATMFPVRAPYVGIDDALEGPSALSLRATSGFLSRLNAGSLRSVEWFKPALSSYIASFKP